MKKNYRRIYFIKKDFQSKFILRFVLITTVWSVVTVSLFAAIARKQLEAILYSSHINVQTPQELLAPVALSVHIISLLLFAVMLLFTIRTLWIKLSVPLFSIKKDIARVASGDLTSAIFLRPGEEFQDLAAELDGMREDMRKKFAYLKVQHEELSDAVAGLSRAVFKGSAAAGEVARFRETAEKMREKLHEFTY